VLIHLIPTTILWVAISIHVFWIRMLRLRKTKWELSAVKNLEEGLAWWRMLVISAT
jgi:hypothetical protein